MCKRGFHFCENPIDVFGYYEMRDDVLIAEVEALGDILQEGTKFCTNKIHITKEITRKQLQALILDGNWNSGNWNSGGCNSGNWNSGGSNSGDSNSGDCNSGDRNSGNWNSGNWNSGIFNTNEPNMRAFNKEADITMTEFLNKINYNWWAFCSRIKENNLFDEDYKRINELPNFNAEIFEEITGIKIKIKGETK
mgnify:CR=1 FL=1